MVISAISDIAGLELIKNAGHFWRYIWVKIRMFTASSTTFTSSYHSQTVELDTK